MIIMMMGIMTMMMDDGDDDDVAKDYLIDENFCHDYRTNDMKFSLFLFSRDNI